MRQSARASNEDIVEWIAARARIRVGGGVRTPEKARRLVDLGVEKVIVGTAAFGPNGPNREFPRSSERCRWTREDPCSRSIPRTAASS